jgi:type VI secretion system protein ImpM
MNHPHYALQQPTEPPGWYGKLPGMGDFAQRRLPNRFVSVWDRWLQNGFEYLRGANADWEKSYLDSQVWFFILGSSVIGPRPWIGLLVPSVDSVGRYFPLTIAIELTELLDESDSQVPMGHENTHVGGLLNAYAAAALNAIDLDFGAERFDQSLTLPKVDTANFALPVNCPKAARSLWHTNSNFQGASGFSMGGMPGNSEFELLFSSAGDATRLLKVMAQ